MAAGVTLDRSGDDLRRHRTSASAPDTVHAPERLLEGRTAIGAACEIHAARRIVDSTVGDRVVVRNYCDHHRVVRRGRGACIGPFAHLRPESDVSEGAHVGNFVELKKTTLGAGSKANHLAYLGDATIGDGVNIGAGTITCNYDGDEASTRPSSRTARSSAATRRWSRRCTIGEGAYVAAGSAITDDVPAGALGIARGRQVNKDGWAAKKQAAGNCQVRANCQVPAISTSSLATSTVTADLTDHYVRHHRLHRAQATWCPSSSMGCAGSNIAATTPRASRSSTTAQVDVRRSAGKLAQPRGRPRQGSARRHVRPRPHAMGDARPADRRERASASRLHGPHRRRPQRHHRELPAS